MIATMSLSLHSQFLLSIFPVTVLEYKKVHDDY